MRVSGCPGCAFSCLSTVHLEVARPRVRTRTPVCLRIVLLEYRASTLNQTQPVPCRWLVVCPVCRGARCRSCARRRCVKRQCCGVWCAWGVAAAVHRCGHVRVSMPAAASASGHQRLAPASRRARRHGGAGAHSRHHGPRRPSSVSRQQTAARSFSGQQPQQRSDKRQVGGRGRAAAERDGGGRREVGL